MIIFMDLINNIASLFKVFNDVKTFPKKEREKYHAIMEENFQLIQSVLNMVIVRLGDILIETDEVTFKREVINLGNYNDWLEVERQFRLCNSLRQARRETEDLWSVVKGKISAKQWDEFMSLISNVLDYEGESASYISQKFNDFSNQSHSKSMNDLKDEISKMRTQLMTERRALIELEVNMYNLV